MIGEEADTLLETFVFAKGEDKLDVDILIAKFEALFVNKKNVTIWASQIQYTPSLQQLLIELKQGGRNW